MHPVDIPIVLSGNFGEIRNNHFHTGLDIKTQGRTGLSIKSVADGSVSRIKVSPFGYGLALYISHPNGYTSVYGHLEKFHPKIEEWVEEQQYLQKSYEVDLFPPAGKFSFKAGEEIAKSGNSGSSGGPHLHFEIRDSKTEEAINPLLFNFSVADNTAPTVYGLQVYALDANSYVNGKAADNFSMGGSPGNYRLRDGDKIEAHGQIGFSLHTIDRLDAASNQCGIFEITTAINGQNHFKMQLDRLDFSTNRYMNGHIDYDIYKRYRKHYHRLHIVENNLLNIYDEQINKGIINCTEDTILDVDVQVKDVAGNTSKLNFEIQSRKKGIVRVLRGIPNSYKVNALLPFEWKGNQALLNFPARCLYQSQEIQIEESLTEDAYPKLIVGDRFIGVQNAFKISLKIPESLMDIQDKILLGKVGDNGRVYPDNTGKIEGAYFSANNRELGTYTLMVDSIAPNIRAINVYNGKEFRAGNTLRFRISDVGAGISSYNLFIDDNWCLATYDYRTGAVNYRVDAKRVKPGKHVLKLVVSDKLGNESIYTTEISTL